LSCETLFAQPDASQAAARTPKIHFISVLLDSVGAGCGPAVTRHYIMSIERRLDAAAPSGLARCPTKPCSTGLRSSRGFAVPDYTPTPDRRYFVVKGRLWRLSNPSLDPETHQRLVHDLMKARRAVAGATDSTERIAARLRVDAAKRALGERGAVWWDDGAPDYNRKLAVNTPYASWFMQGGPAIDEAGAAARPILR
jgi:hypothetical protein